MRKKRTPIDNISEVRSETEKLHDKNQIKTPHSSTPSEEMLRMARELEAYQIKFDKQQKELAQSKDELEKSRKRYTDIYDFAPLAYLTIAPNSSILELNLTAATMLGTERSRLLNKKLADYIDSEDRPLFTALLDKAFKQQKSTSGEFLHLKKAGSTALSKKNTGPVTQLTVSIDAVITETADLCQVILTDVSRLKEIENALLVTTDRLHLIMDATHSCTWVWDLESSDNIRSNNVWSAIDRYCLEKISRNPSYDLWKHIMLPEEKESLDKIILEAIKNEEEFTVEWRVKDLSDEDHWVMSKGSPIKGTNNKVNRYGGFIVDITDLKKARETSNKAQTLNKTIIDSIPGPFYIIDHKGFYAGWNAYDREVIAGIPESEMANMQVIDTVHPEDRALLHEKITNVLEHGIDETVEGRILLRGGPEFRWFLMSARRVIIDGNPLLIGIGTDITDRKKIEDVLRFLSHTSYVSQDEPFFNVLARYLAECLDLDFVCIDILEGDGLTARTLAVWSDGHFEDNVEYTLQDTPCGDVVKNEICSFPANVCNAFSHDKVLKDLQAESYVGVTLRDHSGHPIGLIAVIGRRPLADHSMAEAVLKMVSTRASGELERLLNEEALRKSEKKFRELFERVPIGLYQTTFDGKIISANQAFFDLNISPQSGKDVWLDYDIRKSYVQPQDGVRFRGIILKQGYVNNFEAEFMGADGTTAWLSNTAKMVRGENGNPDFIAGSMIDVTKRKLAEDELKKLSVAITQSPAVVLITDPEGNIEYVNPAFSLLTEYGIEEVKGKNPRILQSGLMPKEVHKNLWDTVLSGEIWQGEFYNRKKTGKLYWEHAVVSAIRDENGRITNFVAVKEDITEKKKLWNDLVEAKEKAEESGRLKSAFLANISHEIRTPMNGILGFSELLKQADLSGEEQQEYIDLIKESGERMLNLINDLIDISRIDAKVTKLEIIETSLNKLLLDQAQFFKLAFNNKGLRLQYTPGLSDEESIIETDVLKLNQILTNLLQNALKFTAKGEIDFGYTRKGDTLEFYVIDSGIGIPEEMRESVFDRFRQVDNSFSRPHEGAGLGLSISKGFVEMLGGTIRVESPESGGAKFLFTLPYNPSGAPNKLRPAADQAIPEFPVSESGKTILIAEDDKLSCILLKKSLKLDNVTFFAAINGKEAVELVECHPEIDLVIMDIKMPVMNGYDATMLIKQMRPGLPVIAQTAFASEDERIKAGKAGFDGFISKPVNMHELFKMIQALLER